VRTLIQGGTLVSEHGTSRRDLLCADGVIVEIARHIDSTCVDHVFDARGLHVLPGLIDPHVHSRDPGQTQKEDFEHSTRAAALAGISTVLEMPNASPPLFEPDSVAERAQYLGAHAYTDFGLWALVFGNESAQHLRRLRDAGVVAAKLFWGYAFDRDTLSLVYDPKRNGENLIPPASNGSVWALLREASKAGLLIGFHCEDRSIVEAATREFGEATSVLALAQTRPVSAESVAVASLVEMARELGARAHVVHVSSGRTAHIIREAQRGGVRITAETCPHYLTFSSEELANIGSTLKVFPPVRGDRDAAELWTAINDGTITSIGSDHAPHACDERQGPFQSQPAGLVGVQTSTRLLLDAVTREVTSLERLVRTMSTNTAKIYGIYPKKGSLMPGADADMTIIDLDQPWEIDVTKLASKSHLSPWAGRRGMGVPVALFIRGRLIMRDGQLTEERIGQALRANPA
jgi:allantoinase